MEAIFSSIQDNLRSNDALRQASGLLQALQLSAAGKDVTVITKSACEEIIASPASAICKKLAFDLIRSTRLTSDQWEIVCRGIRNDFSFPDPDVTAAGVSFLSALPSHLLGKLISDCSKEISQCLVSDSDNLRYAITETLGCILARDDVVTLCENNVNLLERVSQWWNQIGNNTLHSSDAVCKVSFEAVGRLFQEFNTKRMSRLAGDKLVPSENSLAIRSNWIVAMANFVWSKRNSLIARSLVLPIESFRSTVYPLVYATKIVASDLIQDLKKLSGGSKGGEGSPKGPLEFDSAEKIVGVSDVVSHLVPFLSALDPALVFEVAINLLSLADVPGGKPEWAMGSLTAILTLWDRLEFSAARESIVRAVATNLQLLDISTQVLLFKRLLLMVRNLRAESDRMHALACICRTALCVDLFAKESVRRGQKPLPGTDITSLFEDPRIKEDLNSVTSISLFREELVASLVESCFQLSLPLPAQKNSGTESRVIGALAYGTGYGAMHWTESALEVVEVCRPCMKWDCEGRTYAMDCYLKLLVRLCHVYDTRGGIKKVKDGASQDQILNETRLRELQKQLIRDLSEVKTPRIHARLIWALSEHFDLEGLDPLLADDPEDPLNIIISNMHKILFNLDSDPKTTHRLQDVQVVLLCARHLGSRFPRAAQLLTKELEDFRNSNLADSVNKHQCRLILQALKYITTHPEERWAGSPEARGDYPFSHHKLTVQYSEASAAQDRKLEGLVRKAIQELWRPLPSELTLLLTKGIDSTRLKPLPLPVTLTGSSDPCYVEAYHLTDASDGRLTLHLKVINLTEQELDRVDIRVGLTGALHFMDGSLQAVRQLHHVVSQDPVYSSVTVVVSGFERCALWVQVVYYPFHGLVSADINDGDFVEDELSHGQVKRSSRTDFGEPVLLRCLPYKIPLTELLLPHECSPVEYFRIWPSLPAILEFTGAYVYEGSGFRATAALESDAPPFLSGLKSLPSKPFHHVCSHILRTVAGFQLCYSAKTWYGGFLGMMIFGSSEVSRNVDFGDETTMMVCKFILRASEASVLNEIGSNIQDWLDDLTDGGVDYMSEEEVKAAAAERYKKSMEQIAILKAAKPPPQPPKEEEEKDASNEKSKEPSTLSELTAEEAEHRALQAAVLQEWQIFHGAQGKMT
eukprot:TRINITY_DN3987_c0_g1_i1.p1 TRINITY_DN3987_c0_g1~~TRINITY_DN3987_c0_g1_i1.p1  ORF type:complete len:1149 (+),score=195.25 TRINITY_DN3987_c0_g1_i1:231-3677(+)